MRSSIVFVTFLLVGSVVVFSAPASNDEAMAAAADRADLMKGLGMLGLMGLFSVGSMIASHVIKGAIDSRNHRVAIDYFFRNLRKWEQQGRAVTEGHHGRGNETKKHIDDGYDSRSSGLESD